MKDAQTENVTSHSQGDDEMKIIQSFNQVGPDVKEEKSTCRNISATIIIASRLQYFFFFFNLKSDISKKKQK